MTNEYNPRKIVAKLDPDLCDAGNKKI